MVLLFLFLLVRLAWFILAPFFRPLIFVRGVLVTLLFSQFLLEFTVLRRESVCTCWYLVYVYFKFEGFDFFHPPI